jgi:hypothetical protein
MRGTQPDADAGRPTNSARYVIGTLVVVAAVVAVVVAVVRRGDERERVTTEAPEAATTSGGRALQGISLGAEGLGGIDFGVPAEDVVADLSERLGPPDDDTGYVDPSERQVLGGCPAGLQRAVRWGALTVGLLEGATSYDPSGAAHFFTYRLDEPGAAGVAAVSLRTAEGTGLGSSLQEVQGAYGSRAEVVPGDELVEGHIRVDLGSEQPLILRLDQDRVSSIAGGEVCS